MESSSSYEDVMSQEKSRTDEFAYPEIPREFTSIPIIPVPAYGQREAYQVTIGPPLPGAHVTYPVSVSPTQGTDSKGSFETVRRYSDFYALHEVLLQRWPGLVIPQIPPKKLLVTSKQGNKASDVVAYRRLMLEAFLQGCISLSFLSQSEEMDLFLRGQGSFKGFCRTMKRLTLIETAVVYAQVFPDFSRQAQVPDNTFTALDGEYEGLRLLLSSLKQCQITATSLTRHFHHLQLSYGRLAGSILSFESSFLQLFSEQMTEGLFKKWDSDTIANPYAVISAWLEVQCGRVQAILEGYERRRCLLSLKEQVKSKTLKEEIAANKLRAGKNTLSGLLSGKTKVAQIAHLEEQIKHGDETVQALTFIYSVATLRLQEWDLAELKRSQGAAYEAIMKQFGSTAVTAYTTVKPMQMTSVAEEIAAALPVPAD